MWELAFCLCCLLSTSAQSRFGVALGSPTCLGIQGPLLHSSKVQTGSLVADMSTWANLHATHIYIPFSRVCLYFLYFL